MINFDQIMAIIVAAAPSLTAIIGVIFAVIKGIKNTSTTTKEVISKFEELKKEVINTKEFESMKDQLLIAHKENRELKKKLNELLTKIDRIQREGE